jgi:hypothetical protein
MACAEPKEGASFHGVVHKVSEAQMKILDGIESIYGRVPSKAKLYDGSIVDCTVYSDPTGKIDRSNDKPPTERYIQICTEGAASYGVKQEYIDWLKAHEQQPRKDLKDLNFYPLPENAPTMTMEEVKAGNGLDGAPIYYCLNNKVIEYSVPEGTKNREGNLKFARDKMAGRHGEVNLNKMLYDPKYGLPKDNIEDIDPEYRRYLEDMIFGWDKTVP